jgi:hypothetical protein
VLSCFLDHRVDPPNGQGIKTEGQQLSGALNRDGSGIEPEAQQRSVALNIFFKLPALVAQCSHPRVRRELTRSLSSIDAKIGAMIRHNISYVRFLTLLFWDINRFFVAAPRRGSPSRPHGSSPSYGARPVRE